MYNVITSKPSDLTTAYVSEIWADLQLPGEPIALTALGTVPTIACLLSDDGAIHWPTAMFFAQHALASKSLTGDTVRSYAYSLAAWLNYLKDQKIEISDASEYDLQLFRNKLWSDFKFERDFKKRKSKNTVAARVETARRFHAWSENSGAFSSPLGTWALQAVTGGKRNKYAWAGQQRSTISLPSEQRIPRIVTAEELKRIFSIAPEPYPLIFKWAALTGLRRFELCNLEKSALFSMQFLSPNNMMNIETHRKGGRLVSVYLPKALFQDTEWYIHACRSAPKSGMENFVFLSQEGHKLHREEISRVFRRCADSVDVNANFHHLRHTYAVTVLSILQRQSNSGSQINPLKTLQILMGHATLASTEIYLRAMDVYSDEVAEALDFLYGASV